MVALGVLFHALGGFAAGSFYAPCKKVRHWAWESYWLTLGVFAWIIVPPVVAALTVPEFMAVLKAAPLGPLGLAFGFGVLWGVGSITFGLSVRYLGMSLGFAVSLGFCAAFGTLIPPLVNGSLWAILRTGSGWITMGGIALCLAGIAVCGLAGMLKEKHLKSLTSEDTNDGDGEFNLWLGIMVAVFAGVMSACMSFAFTVGKPVQDLAVEMGVPAVRSNVPLLVVILWGGFLTNAVWCIVLSLMNGSYRDFKNPAAPQFRNLLLCALAGTLWYFQFFFYGMGQTQMGDYDFTSWSLHMAFIIITSNILGLLMGEWRGCGGKAIVWINIGTLILVIGTAVIGLGSAMATH